MTNFDFLITALTWAGVVIFAFIVLFIISAAVVGVVQTIRERTADNQLVRATAKGIVTPNEARQLKSGSAAEQLVPNPLDPSPGPRVLTKKVVAYVRRDTAIEWRKANPVLADREIGYETDTDTFRLGDGSTRWTNLPAYRNAERSET